MRPRSNIKTKTFRVHAEETVFVCMHVFIAQGPLPETVEDFWLVVYQQKVTVIAMLTQVIEDEARVRCAAYWPQTVGDTLNIHKL